MGRQAQKIESLQYEAQSYINASALHKRQWERNAHLVTDTEQHGS